MTGLRRAAASACALALWIGAGCAIDTSPEVSEGDGGAGDGLLHATFIDVGQGDSALFELPDGSIVLLDGGEEGQGLAAVWPLLQEKGIAAIDLMILSHPHSDHCGGLDEVMDQVEVDEIWENGEALATPAYAGYGSARNASGAEIVQPTPGDSRTFGEAKITVLATNTGYPDENNDSIVASLTYRGVRILLPGDAEAEEQSDLLAAYDEELRAEILKVSHHGSSDFAAAFPEAVMPDWAVISCGAGNPYGHPHEEALAAYAAISATICRTDLMGDVTFTTDGTDIETNCVD
ncbi:MAG: MBL fold metallo-hydrolase [Proteobacteria bacterium]|nr:MBL fold metallo-hydrolase [Pseudomonadota bacterium]